MKYCFGIDIGGTTVKMGLFRKTESFLTNGRSRHVLRTREKQSSRILAQAVKAKMAEKETGEGTDHRTWNGASGTG